LLLLWWIASRSMKHLAWLVVLFALSTVTASDVSSYSSSVSRNTADSPALQPSVVLPSNNPPAGAGRKVRPGLWLSPEYDNKDEEVKWTDADWSTAVKATQSRTNEKEIKPVVVNKRHEFFEDPVRLQLQQQQQQQQQQRQQQQQGVQQQKPSLLELGQAPGRSRSFDVDPNAPPVRRIIRPVETITPLSKPAQPHPEDETLLNGGEIKPATYSRYRDPCVGCLDRMPHPTAPRL